MTCIKYYDENGYVVGVSCGDITNTLVETNEEGCSHILNLLISKPTQNGFSTNLVENLADGVESYDYEFIKIPDDQLSDDKLIEKFKEEILSSVVVNPIPAAKKGFHLVPCLNGTTISWEFEADAAPTPQ